MADVSAGVEYKINVDGNSFLLDTKKYRLLESILETGSLTNAAKEIKVSYRTALNYIEKMESTLDVKIVSTTKGGKGGGGGTTLTEEKNVKRSMPLWSFTRMSMKSKLK